MKKTAKDFLESKGCYERAKTLEYWQTVPYKHKVAHAKKLVLDFYNAPEVSGKCCISVGGLDSITLMLMIRSMGFTQEQIPAVSVSGLEDKSIQRVHKALGVQTLRSAKSKKEVIEEFGYPIISKEIANRIRILQNPNEKNATIRHAMITGETGQYGGYQENSRMKLADKWLKLFAGSDPEGAELGYKAAPFMVSDKCCYWLKEKPMQDYQKETGRFPFLGLMASEGGRRKFALKHWGCNYISPTVKRSAPFASFMRDDVLRLALEMNDWYQEHWAELNPNPEDKVDTIIPAIYGEIQESGGVLETTKAKRTGCSMCAFGVQLEARPNRFDRLYENNRKEWEYYMYTMGFGKVLSYIGVEWEHDPQLPGFDTFMTMEKTTA